MQNITAWACSADTPCQLTRPLQLPDVKLQEVVAQLLKTAEEKDITHKRNIWTVLAAIMQPQQEHQHYELVCCSQIFYIPAVVPIYAQELPPDTRVGDGNELLVVNAAL